MNILQFIFLLSFFWTFRLFPGNAKLFHEKNKNSNCPNFLSTFDNVILFPPNQKDVCNVSGILVHIFLLLMRMNIYMCVCVYIYRIDFIFILNSIICLLLIYRNCFVCVYKPWSWLEILIDSKISASCFSKYEECHLWIVTVLFFPF